MNQSNPIKCCESRINQQFEEGGGWCVRKKQHSKNGCYKKNQPSMGTTRRRAKLRNLILILILILIRLLGAEWELWWQLSLSNPPKCWCLNERPRSEFGAFEIHLLSFIRGGDLGTWHMEKTPWPGIMAKAHLVSQIDFWPNQRNSFQFRFHTSLV